MPHVKTEMIQIGLHCVLGIFMQLCHHQLHHLLQKTPLRKVNWDFLQLNWKIPYPLEYKLYVFDA